MPHLPQLIPLDLMQCCPSPGMGSGICHDHPDIRGDREYLAKISGHYYAGRFSRQHYGWCFNNWGTSGCQLDQPGTNCSSWEGLWEIV